MTEKFVLKVMGHFMQVDRQGLYYLIGYTFFCFLLISIAKGNDGWSLGAADQPEIHTITQSLVFFCVDRW